MLVLRRKEGQWVEVTHRSGDVLRIRAYRFEPETLDHPACLNLAFDDPDWNFEIERPERKARMLAATADDRRAHDASAATDATPVASTFGEGIPC